MKRKDILSFIKERLEVKGFNPRKQDRHLIMMKEHPQHYLRIEAYATRILNRRILYSSKELLEEFEAIRDKAEKASGKNLNRISDIYQEFLLNNKERLFAGSSHIIFPLDKIYDGIAPEDMTIYAKISRKGWQTMCEYDADRTIAVLVYYFVCGVYSDNGTEQWAFCFDELYEKEHITEYFEGLQVINNRIG
jgi:hypothetical protein